MINTEKIVDELINSIGNIENAKIIRAYPNKDKPTKITKAYIAIKIKEIKLEPYQIDYPYKAGELTVSADLFCPLKWDSSELTKLFSKLCTAVEKYNITSISAENIINSAERLSEIIRLDQKRYDKSSGGN